MIGAIIGDIVGSTYEFAPTKDYNFELLPAGSNYTDDTVMCMAMADAVMHGIHYAKAMYDWGNKYPNPKGGYGGSFANWLHSEERKPYNSFGNGSAMRVAPIGWAFGSLFATQMSAYDSAAVTHSHPEGIKGAVATATAIFMARHLRTKEQIKQAIEQQFSYDLSFDLQECKDTYSFDETCMGTVPVAIKCYLESSNFEDAIRLAVAMGGDADTLACITGAIAEAGYGTHTIPAQLFEAADALLPKEMMELLCEFIRRYQR
ncbi:ADP-ribosylglycohydrolase family protein [Muribaculum intestinale]|uniref:ADP-ribosylglycohydrolase family protein n=1 Tax=Muribaculum intestinale TaxID=1796646 RepID=UPI00272DAD3C|nr:ADP-ribosylglycohydrolase family protein [Muribaculum intestinale]